MHVVVEDHVKARTSAIPEVAESVALPGERGADSRDSSPSRESHTPKGVYLPVR